MSTLRRSFVLLALTVIAALLAGLAVLDPFHLRHAAWFAAPRYRTFPLETKPASVRTISSIAV